MTKPKSRWALGVAVLATALRLPAADGLPEGWYAVVDTSKGSFTIRLLVEQAPQTVAHFAAFAEGRIEWIDTVSGEAKKEPYYDGVLVHKISKMERIEAGDRTGTGRGYPLVYVPLERGPVDFTRPYRVGMTGSAGGKVSAVLFFVTRTNQDFLNNRYPCFGEVVVGRETVDAIASVRVDRESRPLEPVEIRSIRIRSAGNPAPLPEPVPFTPKTPKLGRSDP